MSDEDKRSIFILIHFENKIRVVKHDIPIASRLSLIDKVYSDTLKKTYSLIYGENIKVFYNKEKYLLYRKLNEKVKEFIDNE